MCLAVVDAGVVGRCIDVGTHQHIVEPDIEAALGLRVGGPLVIGDAADATALGEVAPAALRQRVDIFKIGFLACDTIELSRTGQHRTCVVGVGGA